MALELDPRKTALVMIDLQKGILNTPRAPYSVEAILPRVSRVRATADVLAALAKPDGEGAA